jgi:DNA methylase
MVATNTFDTMLATRPLILDLDHTTQTAFVAGARDLEPVRGLTHGFYKYPARFSPSFVRAAIETFTRPRDLILDNHVGGGTTLVEALALGRRAIGVDISTLASFVATVKTTVFDEAELDRLTAWANRLLNAVNVRKSSVHFSDYAELGYYKHLDHPLRWRLRKAIEQGLGSAIRLRSKRLESFGRCVVLRTAQWALDGRKNIPSISEFRETLTENAIDMVDGARQLSVAVKRHPMPHSVRILNRSAARLEDDNRLAHWPAPNLVVTSPPYPGVHVLYHRWQVDGRKEAPLPFMIADKLDGSGSSFYTMGDRKYPGLKTYFDNIRATMSSIAALADENTTVVQIVAFSDHSWQLQRYLETMEESGLSEVFLPLLQSEGDGRLWRKVPGRRWYSDQRGDTPGSQEVVLIHRKRGAEVMPLRQQLRTRVRNRQ